MLNKYLKSVLTIIVLTSLPFITIAQDSRVEVLERALQERDQVILELLERVEALENRFGIARPEPDVDDTPQASRGIPAETTNNQPGAIVVDEATAERALERSLTREGALLLPRAVLEFEPSFSYIRREDTTSAFVQSGDQFLAGETERNADGLAMSAGLRLGLPWDSQLEINIPYRWRKIETVTNVGFSPTDSSSQSGSAFGDVRVGFAKTLLREGLWWPDLIGRATWDTDSGSFSDNNIPLGGGFHELQGSLTAIKRQDPIAFVGGLSYQHSIEQDQIRPGSIISANFGGFIALSPETSLRLQILGAYQDETRLMGSVINGSDRTIGSFVVGGSTLLLPGVLLNLSVGIGLTDDADDFSISLSVPIRMNSSLF
jgi:hypothetical protein